MIGKWSLFKKFIVYSIYIRKIYDFYTINKGKIRFLYNIFKWQIKKAGNEKWKIVQGVKAEVCTRTSTDLHGRTQVGK